MGKWIVQFDCVTKDVTIKEGEAQPPLDHDINAMMLDDNPEIMQEESDNNEDIMGWPAQSQNAVAVPSLIERVLAAVVYPTVNATQNPNTGVVPQSVGGVALPGRVRTES